jgi:hypothetical protein
MGQGKLINFLNNDKYRVKMGTMDKKNNKSFYVNLSSWLAPKNDNITSNYHDNIREVVDNILSKHSISKYHMFDLDLREQGMKKNKRSFMSLEMTFLNYNGDFSDNTLKKQVNKLCDNINHELIEHNKDFTFHAKKN